MKNILLSSTSQWNPGDEFIAKGILNILQDTGLEINPLLYNRNPLINPPRAFNPGSIHGRGWRRKIRYALGKDPHDESALRENSFNLDHPLPVDYVIFAGTPEWAGGIRATPLLEFIKRNNVRCSFLGVGLAEQVEFSPLLKFVLKENTDVFTCRDQRTFESVRGIIKAQLITCPSILSSRSHKARTSLGCIGCGIQGTQMKWQSITQEHQIALYDCYCRLAQNHPIEYIAHHIDDLRELPKGDVPTRYSYFSEDYYSIYDRYDLVVNSRLHGCGIAASLGIPSICIAHDGRGAAAEYFGAVVVNSAKDVDRIVHEHDWVAQAEKVLKIKASTASAYESAITPILDRLGNNKRP